MIIYSYLTAGTDEVSRGMVKRVLTIPTWGARRNPGAVSESRIKAGEYANNCTGRADPDPDLSKPMVLEHLELEFAECLS